MNNFSEDLSVLDAYRSLAIYVCVFFVIAGSPVAGAQVSPRPVTDAEVLPAILEAALSQGGPVDLRVDPRPLRADAAYLYGIQPEAFAPVSAPVVDRRSAMIRTAGLRTVDTTVVNQSRNCPGPLVLSQSDSLGRVDNRRVVGCPEEPFDVLAVGPPRPGSPAIPEDRVYDRAIETAACGYWAARVIRTTLGHGRSTVYAADYVLAERAGKWVVVKVVGLIYSE